MKEQTKTLKRELKSIREDLSQNREKTEVLEKKVSDLSIENVTLGKTIQHQQKFMESLDYEQRKSNVIITGVSEIDDLPGVEGAMLTSDEEKIQHVFKLIGQEGVHIASMTRLGKPPPNMGSRTRSRPIKLTLQAQAQRRNILQASRTLNSAAEPFSRIYMKRDMHPDLSKEFRRLRDVERTERANPENEGRTVRYDHTTRTVMVDDQIIDRFQAPFQ